MTTESTILDRDPFWDIYDANDYETFQKKFLHEIYLMPQVHADVRESFRVIQRLFAFGFDGHKFFEAAYTKAVLTLEMAFRQRYWELKGKEWKGDLWPLMTWLHGQNYFDVYNSYFLKNIKDIRNHFDAKPHPSWTILHETFHLLGLSDRNYPNGQAHPGFKNDIMGNGNFSGMSQTHWNNYGTYILEKIKSENNPQAQSQTQFILKHRVDIIGPHAGPKTLLNN